MTPNEPQPVSAYSYKRTTVPVVPLPSTTMVPLFTPSPVIVARDLQQADELVSKLVDDANSGGFFGFDLEITSSKRVRLVQIATRHEVYIFDIEMLEGFPRSLSAFIGNPAYIKLGVGVAGDARTLVNAHKVELRGGGELSRLHRLFDLSGAKLDLPFNSCVALDTLAEQWAGKRLDKTLQNGKEWDGPLQAHHYRYAAADACVALAIYDKMMAVEPLANARTSLWIFTEFDPFTSQCVGLRDDYAPHVAMNPKYIRSIEGALRKARTLFEQANDELSGDANHSWTQQTMPDETILLDALSSAFAVYHLSQAASKQ